MPDSMLLEQQCGLLDFTALRLTCIYMFKATYTAFCYRLLSCATSHLSQKSSVGLSVFFKNDRGIIKKRDTTHEYLVVTSMRVGWRMLEAIALTSFKAATLDSRVAFKVLLRTP